MYFVKLLFKILVQQVDSSLASLSNANRRSYTSTISTLIGCDMEIDTVDGQRPSAHRYHHARQSSHAPDKAAEILRLKRKILRDQRTRNQHFASMEIKRQKLRDVAMERRKAAKDKKVSCNSQ